MAIDEEKVYNNREAMKKFISKTEWCGNMEGYDTYKVTLLNGETRTVRLEEGTEDCPNLDDLIAAKIVG